MIWAGRAQCAYDPAHLGHPAENQSIDTAIVKTTFLVNTF